MRKCIYSCEEQWEEHHQRVSESLVVTLESKTDVFLPVCDSEIGIVDIGTSAIEVHLMKTLVIL